MWKFLEYFCFALNIISVIGILVFFVLAVYGMIFTSTFIWLLPFAASVILGHLSDLLINKYFI